MDWQMLASEIETYVRPDSFPLAVRVVRPPEPLPPRVRRPKQDLGVRVALCQGISLARRYGWSIAMGPEDMECPIAQVAFGFEPETPYYTDGNLAAGMYVETCAQGAVSEAVVPKLSADEAGVICVAPLARATFEPEVVVVYGNSAQVVRLAAAALWKTGGALQTQTMARADCTELIIRTRREQRPQVVLPCMGDRIFAQTQDHEMAFAFPVGAAEDLLEGLKGTHKGGIRYPVPHYLRYQPKMPPAYQRLQQEWEREKAE